MLTLNDEANGFPSKLSNHPLCGTVRNYFNLGGSMSDIPNELRYSKSHEWVRVDEGNLATIGITDHAQEQMGDLVFVELPEMDEHIDAGDEVAVVESVKTAADVYSPLSGAIIEINEAVQSEPALVNRDPYGDGGLYRVKIDDVEELEGLMDGDAYEEAIKEEV